MSLTFLSFYFNIPGVLRQVLWVFLFMSNLKYVKIECQMDRFVLLYFLSSFLTLSGNIIMPYPIENFAKVFIYSYLPIILYFIAKNQSGIYPSFIKRSNIGIMILLILGFYFLLFPTPTYVNKALEFVNINGHYTEETLKFARFASFMDSYHTANLGVCSLCFSFGLLYFSRDTMCKNSKYNKILGFLFIIASVMAILLARQRVAMYVGIIIFIYYLFNSGFNRFVTYSIIIPLIIIGFYKLFTSADAVAVVQATQSFSKDATSTLFSSRTYQWLEAIDGFCQAPLFGLGVGSSGHVAFESNFRHPIVTDGSYFKILIEGGIFSFYLFMFIIIVTLRKAFKYRKRYYMEFPLLLFFACSLIGANIIDMPYIIFFFWYIIGRVNRKNYVYE